MRIQNTIHRNSLKSSISVDSCASTCQVLRDAFRDNLLHITGIAVGFRQRFQLKLVMGGTGVATMVRSNVLSAAEAAQHKPLGLGSSSLSHQPLGTCPKGPRSLRRQWTTAKPRNDTTCNALPFFLDLSLAFAPGMEFLDAVKSSVDSEVVFQATLQVPAHHALACRLNAYGTPFAAPDLQAAAHELRDEDLEFAACLAAPPDLDEQLSVNFGRVMSMLEKNQGQTAEQVATRAAQQAHPNAGNRPGAVGQQAQLRPAHAAQRAPKVLVSVDEAESTAAQLQRTNSTKKQPKLSTLLDDYGKRALHALLGLGYLLTVLHEKSLGGKIQFSAGFARAGLISPTTSDSHMRPRRSTGFGVLAGLRQLMQDCPSLSPALGGSISFRQAAAVAPGGATSGGCHGSSSCAFEGGTPKSPSAAPESFEAAWDRVVHPPLNGMGGGGGGIGSRAMATPGVGLPACPSLQVQLSLSAPCRMRSSGSLEGSTAGSAPETPFSSSFKQQQQVLLPGSAGFIPMTPEKLLHGHLQQLHARQQQDIADEQPVTPKSHVPIGGQQQLHQTCGIGRGDGIDAVIDHAIHELQRQQQETFEPTGQASLVPTGESVFAQAANATGTGMSGDVAASTPVCLRSLQHTQHHQEQTFGPVVRSFYLADQGPVTSPLCTTFGTSATITNKLPTPGSSPWVIEPMSPNPTPGLDMGHSGSSIPATPGRMLMPVMSMRLTCHPSRCDTYSGSSCICDTLSRARDGVGVQGGGAILDASAPDQLDCKQGSGTSLQLQRPPGEAHSASPAVPSLTVADFIAAVDADSSSSSSANASVESGAGPLIFSPTSQIQLQPQLGIVQVGCTDTTASETRTTPATYPLPGGLWHAVSFSLVPLHPAQASPK